MRENLRVNMLRMFHNRRLYYCLAGMTTVMYLSGLSYIKGDNADYLDDCLGVVTTTGFIVLYYVLCVIGGGLDYCEDSRNYYTKYMVVRKGIQPYAKAKVISAALGGFVSMMLSLLGFELLMMITFWIYKGSFREIFSGDINYIIQGQWDMLIFCLLGSVLSVFALMVTTFIPNVFVGTVMPILVYYIVICISNKYGMFLPLLPSCVYFGFSELFKSRPVHFVYAFVYTGCVLYFFSLVIEWRMRRSMYNA